MSLVSSSRASCFHVHASRAPGVRRRPLLSLSISKHSALNINIKLKQPGRVGVGNQNTLSTSAGSLLHLKYQNRRHSKRQGMLKFSAVGPRLSSRCLCTGSHGASKTEDDFESVFEEEEQQQARAGGNQGHFKLKELETPGTVLTGTNVVGKQVFEAAEKVISELRDSQSMELAIFSFGFEVSHGKAYLRLDKLDNKYGSPTLDEIDVFSRKLGEILAEVLGEAVSDDIEFEVSSPGAERELLIPGDLDRFSELPLCVEIPKEAFQIEGVDIKKSKNDMYNTVKVVMTVCNVNLEKGEMELAPFKSKRNENTFGRKTWNKILKSGKTLRIKFEKVSKVNLHLEI